MPTTRPKIKIEPYYIEYLIREVERNQNELNILRAEAKITHGFLGLVDKLTRQNHGEVCSSDNPLQGAKKALEAGIFELQSETAIV